MVSTGDLALTRVATRETMATFIPMDGAYGIPMVYLSRLIDDFPALRNAEIASSECWTAPIRFGVLHRFLVLELRREGRKSIWLRLERTRFKGDSAMKFIWQGGQTRANDIVSDRSKLQRDPTLI